MDGFFFRKSYFSASTAAFNSRGPRLKLLFGDLLMYLFININQLDALNFIISLFQTSTCFDHMCSTSGGQNCIIESLVSSHQ